MKENMICVVYVNDTIFTGTTQAAIDKEIKLLGMCRHVEKRPFEFRDEGEISAFLGIKIDQKGGNEYHLSQHGLIKKVLKAAGMEDCKPNLTPANIELLGPSLEAPSLNEIENMGRSSEC